MYGQQPVPPRGPFVPVGAKPAKPGPTGPGVAIGSACVPIAFIVGIFVVRFVVEQFDLGGWFASLAFVALDVIPLVYLLVVGRGMVGKLVGGGLMAFALVLDLVNVVFVRLVDGWPTWAEVLNFALGLLITIVVITAWGIARRAGWLWTVSIPVGIVTWAIWTFGLSDMSFFAFDHYDGKTFGNYFARPVLFVVVQYVTPIVIGWLLEVLTRGSTTTPLAQQPPAGPWQQGGQFGPGRQYGQRPQGSQQNFRPGPPQY
ncbi:hypothetical protein [Tsukamurella sp. PLM1]|uniref:hypothetical protein n=1 Tax=Tsukamurella sp. PLM1 TaxID=2929795 RepID=UPI00206DC17C|nr:hypothetical protein [Tsukamurella sp. PLM1]BDH57017.1 hypothetical protein MTP03_19560 [Tsukamurella sp. PLM1]